MGMMRKLMSGSTGGLVDWRSDKERTAAYTKAAKNQAKKQTRLMAQQAQAARQAQARMASVPVQPVPTATAPPPGWYADPDGGDRRRWWDGTRWTEHRLWADA